MITKYVAVCLLAACVQFQWAANARERRLGSEARVEQARGNLPPGSKAIEGGKLLKGTPEAGSNSGTAVKTGPTAPVTCNQQNSSSPACYSATQQSRPVAR